jgi:Rieske Fe-S protein
VPLKPGDIDREDLVLAWGFDPRQKIVRSASRLNMVLLMRFDPGTLDQAEQQMGPDGILAYSAVCTHQQCWVTDWLKSTKVLQCPCHQSQYDLRHGAKVVGGPAPRPLPALPLKLSDNLLAVAGPFTGRVGGEQQQGA